MSQCEADGNMNISHKEFASFLSALPSHAERERTKHVFASSHNMSSCQSTVKVEKVQVLIEKVNRIKSKHIYFAQLEQNVFLESQGCDPHTYLSSSDSSDSDTNTKSGAQTTEKHDCNALPEIDLQANNSEGQRENLVVPVSVNANCDKSKYHFPSRSDQTVVMNDQPTEDILSLVDVNIALNILREADWNWFSLVANLESMFYRPLAVVSKSSLV